MHAGGGYFAVALAAAAVGLAAGLAPGLHVPCDFVAFWSSAVLFADGHNPYDPALLLPLQYDAGFRLGYAIPIFYPPWVLPLFAPLAALPVKAAFAVWLGVQLALVLVAGKWLWRALGGRPGREWVAVALSVAFVPTFLLLTCGQTTGIALFGFAGYLRFRRTSPTLAGVLAALTAVKPHLFGLFAVALVIDAVRSAAGREVLVRGAAVLVGLALTALVAKSCVFEHYRDALTAPASAISKTMSDYPAPVVGVMFRDWLRGPFPRTPGAVAFLPLLVAVPAVATFFRSGPEATPWLVAASLVVAPYGAWWYDMVLLLPLVLLAAVRLGEADSPQLARAGVLALALFDLAVLVLYARRDQLTPLFALVPPLTALGCFALLRVARQPSPQTA